jgi:uncharacterized protein
MKKPWFPYVLPFALFLLLTGPVRYFPAWSPFLYIAKTIIVAALLWFWRHSSVASWHWSSGLCRRISFPV